MKSEDDKKKPVKVKPSALGYGMARKAGEVLSSRKRKMDLAIKEAGG